MPSESTLTAQPQLNLTNETSSVPAALASSSPTPSKKLTAVREALVQADVSWHDFAYLQRATDLAYLCNSVMILETIHRLGCRADRLLLYPKQWDVESEESDEGRLLRQARDTYGVKLKPIEVHTKFASDPTWTESYTKLLAFNQTAYTRVLGLDSDATVLKCMDEVFLLPPAPIAMPRAYWLWHDHEEVDADHAELSSQMVLIMPNADGYKSVMDATTEHESEGEMDILNAEYLKSAMVLPHRPYDLVTGEFRYKSHTAYLGNEHEVWDPEVVLQEAKYLHFSDWPIRKPWRVHHEDQLTTAEAQIERCDRSDTVPDCRNWDLWLGFFEDLSIRRRDVCKFNDLALSVPRGVRDVTAATISASGQQWEPRGL